MKNMLFLIMGCAIVSTLTAQENIDELLAAGVNDAKRFSENYIKIKSKYQSDLTNTLKKVEIKKIESNNTTCATGSLIKHTL